jgi:hypothetical protein
MFAIAPTLGKNIEPVGPHVLEKLEKAYNSNRIQKDEADKKSQAEIGQFLDGIVKKAIEEKKKQDAILPSPNAPAPPHAQSPPSDDPTKKQP